MANVNGHEHDDFGNHIDADSNITDARAPINQAREVGEDGHAIDPVNLRGMTDEERAADEIHFLSAERRAFPNPHSISSEVWGMVTELERQLKGVEWSTFQMTVRKDRWVRQSGRDIIVSASVQATGPITHPDLDEAGPGTVPTVDTKEA